MGNHFHLVLETPHANLVAGMKWFLLTYTSRFNRRHKLFGQLFTKINVALRLRSEATMTWSWIAGHLHMGAAGYAANCLRRA